MLYKQKFVCHRPHQNRNVCRLNNWYACQRSSNGRVTKFVFLIEMKSRVIKTTTIET